MTSLTRVAALAAAIVLFAPRTSGAFAVNSTGDITDNNPGNGECWTGAMDGATKVCTLRAAIMEVNATAAGGTITFAIPSVTANFLPAITKPVTIDGTAQGRAEVRGVFNGADVTLVLTGGASTVRKLVLGNGIRFENGDGNLLEDCYIGTDPTSTIARGGSGAQFKDSANNVIRKNVISGNGQASVGLLITGATASDNTVVGNFIGCDAGGTIKVTNGINAAGVHIVNAPRNTIGGPTEADRNVISGTGSGVVIFGATASENVVVGNIIGTDITGTVPLEEFGGSGVRISEAPNNLVESNLISGNNNNGVQIADASGNKVLDNLIGTDASGLTDVVSSINHVQYVGVRLTDAVNNVIGEPGAGNTISGNEFGVAIEGVESTGNRVESNRIGPNDDDDPLGNRVQGVYILANGNVIGGFDPTKSNTIAYNGHNGVAVLGGVDNAIVNNTIFANDKLGIDLGIDDVTPNDDDDADGGPNGSLNFPEFEPVNGVLQGTLTTKPGTYRVELFVVNQCDGSGHGEGDQPLGGMNVTVGASGFATFTPPAPERGRFLTATATELVGGEPKSTSEFSACAAAPGAAPPAKGDFTVDSLGDEPDANPGNGACATADGKCTLRAAIQEANVLPKRQRVVFNVGGGGPFTIRPGPPGLPVVDRPLVIDATTQPGAALAPLIELDGSNAGPGANGLELSDDKNAVRGLVINRFAGHGISLTGQSGKSVVQGNYIGTDVTGTLARGNGGDGIHVSGSPKNLIGGPAVNLGNVVSGNLGHGMAFEFQANGNIVMGNAVGTNAARTAAVANLGSGIVLAGTTAKNVVGSDSLVPNVVSGNAGAGVAIGPGAAKHKLLGNRIGTDGAGNAKVPNRIGIVVEGAKKIDIGDGENSNVVSGNTEAGIRIAAGATKIDIVANYVGTNAEGTAALGNGGPGIAIDGASDNTIEGNLIGDNDFGIGISGSGAFENTVKANLIGTDEDRAIQLGNKGYGVYFLNDAHDNLIGGRKKDGNVIAFNGSATSGGGVAVVGGVRNAIRVNAVFSNAPLNIDLGGDGITTSDLGDADVGPNALQNAPELLQANRNGDVLELNGRLRSSPKGKFVLDLFLTDACPAASGDGARYWRSFKLSTGDDGTVEFLSKAKEKGVTGGFLAATVTDKVGNTSELLGVRLDRRKSLRLRGRARHARLWSCS